MTFDRCMDQLTGSSIAGYGARIECSSSDWRDPGCRGSMNPGDSVPLSNIFINGGKDMKKWLIGGVVICLLVFFFPWSKAQAPAPGMVVENLLAGIAEVKDAAKKMKDDALSEEAAGELAESRASVEDAFLNPRRAKAMVFTLMVLDLENMVFLEEKIDGDNAEVLMEYTVVGFGEQSLIDESARKRDRITFLLKKQKGRWKVADIR